MLSHTPYELRPHKISKFQDPKYNEYIKYNYIVGFVLVVFWSNTKQIENQICHIRGNVPLVHYLSIQSANRSAIFFASAVTACQARCESQHMNFRLPNFARHSKPQRPSIFAHQITMTPVHNFVQDLLICQYGPGWLIRSFVLVARGLRECDLFSEQLMAARSEYLYTVSVHVLSPRLL